MGDVADTISTLTAERDALAERLREAEAENATFRTIANPAAVAVQCMRDRDAAIARAEAAEELLTHATQFFWQEGPWGPDVLVEAPCEDAPKWSVTDDAGPRDFDTRDEAIAFAKRIVSGEIESTKETP